MTRRELTKGFGALALANTTRLPGFGPVSPSSLHRLPTGGGEKLIDVPRVVAGIRIVDSTIAKQAIELSRDVSAPFLFNHAMRTSVFGALIGVALQQSFDQEILFLACILHDLGLTHSFMGDLPFEIQGAQAAKDFLERSGVPKDRTMRVWDGIAMHPLAIGQFKEPEIALVGAGAGADVIGPDFSQIRKADATQVVSAFPRLNFKNEFINTCATVVRQHPRGASRTFMRDIGERYVAAFHPKNLCDAIKNCPLDE